jgi:hypothetical protein
MPFISTSTLTKLATIASKALIDDCTIERNSVQNGQVTPAPIETVKCLVKPLNWQNSTIEDYSANNIMLWRVSFPLNTNPQEGDVLTINGQKMTVQKVYTPESYSVFDQVDASGVKS